MESLLFAACASLPLVLGAPSAPSGGPPRTLLTGALAFATGTLIASLAFELVGQAYRAGDRRRAQQPATPFGALRLLLVTR